MLGVLLATLSCYRMLLPSELAIHVGVLGVRTVYCYQNVLLPSRMATLIGRQRAGLLESFCLAMLLALLPSVLISEAWGSSLKKVFLCESVGCPPPEVGDLKLRYSLECGVPTPGSGRFKASISAMSASDNTSVIDATRTMLKALDDNSEGLEAIWRGAATKDQTQDMINLLELAQVSAADKRHMQEAAQLAAEREARSAAAKTSFPPATPRGANKATTASSKRQASPPRPRRRDVTPPPSFWADITDTPATEKEPQWMLDMAKHTLAEQMAKLKGEAREGARQAPSYNREDADTAFPQGDAWRC